MQCERPFGPSRKEISRSEDPLGHGGRKSEIFRSEQWNSARQTLSTNRAGTIFDVSESDYNSTTIHKQLSPDHNTPALQNSATPGNLVPRAFSFEKWERREKALVTRLPPRAVAVHTLPAIRWSVNITLGAGNDGSVCCGSLLSPSYMISFC